MFIKLQAQVQKRFEELSATGQLFYIDIDRDKIWELYLAGWANDPIEQQGHNCSCCKSFLRQYAGIVAIVENKVLSIWDIQPDELYAAAIKNVRDYVLSRPITDVFMNPFEKLGVEKNADGKKPDMIWNHFFIKLPRQFVVKNADSIPSKQGELRTTQEVFKRGLDELTIDALDTVLDLIAQDSLYRGVESKGVLLEFQKFQREYKNVPAGLKHNYAWAASMKITPSLARIRNTAMGTLLDNLSKGMDLDSAVTKYETMMDARNYKRPTALVTPRMVEDAKNKLTELGYLESLDRRFAVDTDLDINNILFIDKSSTLTNVFEDMKKDTAVNPRTLAKTEEIGIDAFLSDVLPRAKALHVLLENSHLNNMMTMLTAVNGAPTLFKWNNPFSWAYTGGITDSIKERVKQAGGRVDGEIRVSLSWHNYDDLDLHLHLPNGGHVYYSGHVDGRTGTNLDVDMNAGHGQTRNAVENIVVPDVTNAAQGRYRVVVHNFTQREMSNVGFTVQIECRGEIFDLEFPKNPRNHEYQNIVEFDYNRQNGLVMVGEVKSNVATKDKWNLKTNRFHKVKHVLLSPNCWGETDKGNKHHFFILENCASDEATRPFFNEFLKEELVVHRKFFEVLGAKLSVSPTSTQLAGLGFSETQRNQLIVRVDGAFQRTLRVKF